MALRIELLTIPWKACFQSARVPEADESGGLLLEPADETTLLEQLTDNYNTFERWVTIWIRSAANPPRCNLLIPHKELPDLSLKSAAWIFESYKAIERWAFSAFTCDCGSVDEGEKLADRCRLFIPFKDCYAQWQVGFIDLATAQAQDFENWKAIERWAFLYYNEDCVCCVPSGGRIEDIDGWRYHIFDEVGTFELTLCGQTVEALVVAGGGGSATNQAAGGAGAGGMLTDTLVGLFGTYIVTVGAGGFNSFNPLSLFGEDSSLDALMVAIGGGGSGDATGGDGGDGGSGGGAASGILSSQPPGFGGSGVPGQGNDGGRGGYAFTLGRTGGGGGGAGAPGVPGKPNPDFPSTPDFEAGNGGDGLEWPAGSGNYYAGGGGGGLRSNPGTGTQGLGGLGGGGDGGTVDQDQQAGTPATGGGAGGRGFNNTVGADGGSGIVIVRYPIPV